MSTGSCRAGGSTGRARIALRRGNNHIGEAGQLLVQHHIDRWGNLFSLKAHVTAEHVLEVNSRSAHGLA